MIGTSIGNSLIWDNGTNVGIGNTNTSYTLDVSGTLRNTTSAYFATTSGSVGIGTASPSEQLNLMGAGAYTSKIRISWGSSATSYYTNFGYNSDGNKAYLQIADGGAAATIMTWNYNGNVGIGTSSPNARLSLGNTTSTAKLLLYDGGFTGSGGNGYFAGFAIDSPNANDTTLLAHYQGALVFGRYTNANSTGAITERMRIRSDGNIGINDSGSSLVKLAVQGQSTSSSDYVSAWYNSAGTTLFYVRNDGYGFINAAAWAYGSDLRIKENISDVENGLDMVLKMKPKHFDYIDGQKDNLGFIAQDIEEIIPQAVNISDESTGMLALKTDFLIPYLVKAIQEMNTKLDDQNQTIQNLQEQINILAK